MTWPLGVANVSSFFCFSIVDADDSSYELLSVRKLDLKMRHRGRVDSPKIDRRVLDINCVYIVKFLFSREGDKLSHLFSSLRKIFGDAFVIFISLFAKL